MLVVPAPLTARDRCAGRPMRWHRVAWLATATVAAASVFLRILHRGPYTPGWDVLSAAQGLHLVSTQTPREILDWYVANHWNSQIGWNLYGVFSVLLPGLLASLWPWAFWNHVVTFLVAVSVIALLALAFEVGARDSWIVMLGWCASPALVSQSVTGLAYVTSALPHALALCTVRRVRDHPVATAVLGIVVYLVAWQGQELGRTAGLVFLVAAATTAAPWSTRVAWLVTGGFVTADAIWHPTYNTFFFAGAALPGVREMAVTVLGVAERLFLRPTIDLPVLVGAGGVAALLLRREPWPVRLLLAAQVALLVPLALRRGVEGVWPRRFIMVDIYALAAILQLWNERRGSRVHIAALTGVLAVGAGWQLAETVRFVRQPVDATLPVRFTLPFVQSNVDYSVTPADIDWAALLEAEARAGRAVILAYNHASYQENATNPSGVPERLYLALGHGRFVDRVFLFGDTRRWNDLPIRPLDELDGFVDGIGDPADFVVYLAVHPRDGDTSDTARVRRAEIERLLAALGRRFDLVTEPPRQAGHSTVFRLTLQPRAEDP